MTRVLICGSGGFIGGHLVKAIVDAGHEVVAADLKLRHEWWQWHENVRNYQGCDLCDFDNCRQACQGVDQVYQLAADMGGAGYVFTGENDAAITHNSAQMLQKLINGRDEIVDKAGGYAGRQLADATNAYVALESRRLMARELYKTAPDLKTVNQAYHYWANATDLLQAAVERKTGQQRTMHNLFKILLGMGGGGAYVSGNDPVLGAATGRAVAGMAELMTTPQWRSVSAHLKKRLANSIERGDWTSAQRIIGRLMAAGSAQATAGSE